MGRPRIYVVALSPGERKGLRDVSQKGHSGARVIRRAQTLLLADEGYENKEIARVLGVSSETVNRTNKRYVNEGLDSTLVERPRPGHGRKLSGRDEAQLVALACSDPPEGQTRWSLRLLADRLVELDIVEDISYQTVRRTLKKTRSNRG
tara:strand:+ start:113 stop:559 length:447 start_codon:yes stop_codon:yes gene_type:complete